MRGRILCALWFVVTTLAVAARMEVQERRIPVPPIHTTLGSMPGMDALPVRGEMPDVAALDSGQRVTSAAQWQQRRGEMKQILTYYAVGRMPPAPGNVRGAAMETRPLLHGMVEYRLVHLSFGPDRKLGFDIAIFVPAGKKPPYPTVIYPSFLPTPGAKPLLTMPRPPEQGKGADALTVPLGDPSARIATALSDALPQASSPSAPDPEQAAGAHAELLRRGYALVTYHYQDAGEDTIGRNTDGSWAFRNTRFFPAYPKYDWGLLGSWAWGISRVIDYLQTQSFCEKTQLIATGHSRIGKAVLVAGAFDERLSVVAPAGSGAGGTGSYRFNGAGRGGKEGLDDMMRKYPNWFSPHLIEFAGHTDKLPFDQHWFIALAAPRAFLSLEGADDQNCVPNALRQAWQGAMPAYGLFKAESRLGVNFANHRHALTAEDWEALLDFADLQLRNRKSERRFDQFPLIALVSGAMVKNIAQEEGKRG